MTTSGITSATTDQSRSTWQIDPIHSSVEFSVRHLMISTVKGRFTDLKGTIVDVQDDPTKSSVEVVVNTASVSTNDERRDAHLRSPDFFDVEKFPSITFKSTRIEGTRDAFTLTGDLTIRDQTRPVTMDVTFNGTGNSPFGTTVASFSAETKLNRKDFGLNWNVGLEAGGVMVSDQFKVALEIEAVKDAS